MDARRSADDREFVVGLLEDTLAYARARDYTGPDRFDGTRSGLLRALPIESEWADVAVREGIERAPVNLRPLFLVEETQSFEGTALFAMANRTTHRSTSDGLYADEADYLADWLLENRDEGYSGFCGGRRRPVQQRGEFDGADTPNVVSTAYAVKALCRFASRDDRYAEAARSAAEFLLEDLRFKQKDDGARIVYRPGYDGEYYSLGGGAVGAHLLLDLYDRFGEEAYRERAAALLDYIAERQTDSGGWNDRVPASASDRSASSYHNGLIVESYLRYHEVTGEERYADTVDEALRFYREVLFEPDGAPNRSDSARYPRDIHAAAQGIVVFSKSGHTAFARRIIDWTLANLYGGQGQFYYQKRRLYTKQYTLMRGCQGWMAYALSEYLSATTGSESGSGTERGSVDESNAVGVSDTDGI
ncbi:hypothetical protein SAMN04488063_2847 [Halopelagius inordinatus]|uniref:Antibiotic ABC transporter permease n=2 Tax=Halopelagius inordinatus TaxID=553467 RepID=A0A1I2UAI7_9EURY|nr:hypothetical protein SAMN04488063_2847 [Halopelagius inordinatus]